jgi:hypothetical protein
VIVSYRDKRTRDFAGGKFVKAFSGFERSARMKLDRLEGAVSLGTWPHCPETVLKRCSATARASTAFA